MRKGITVGVVWIVAVGCAVVALQVAPKLPVKCLTLMSMREADTVRGGDTCQSLCSYATSCTWTQSNYTCQVADMACTSENHVCTKDTNIDSSGPYDPVSCQSSDTSCKEGDDAQHCKRNDTTPCCTVLVHLCCTRKNSCYCGGTDGNYTDNKGVGTKKGVTQDSVPCGS